MGKGMQVVFNPRPEERECGLTSFASWNTPNTQETLRRLFNTSKSERLVRVE